MADELKEEFGATVALKKSRGGIFDVHVDGELVFSKHALDRHAEPGEVLGLLRDRST